MVAFLRGSSIAFGCQIAFLLGSLFALVATAFVARFDDLLIACLLCSLIAFGCLISFLLGSLFAFGYSIFSWFVVLLRCLIVVFVGS